MLQNGPGGVEAVKPYNERGRWSGAVFSYASVETQVLGLVLRSVVGRPVAEYFRDRIWEPIGAEADATWIIDASGQEATYCCLNAVLRDYARLGLLLAHDGNWRGRQIIPAVASSPDGIEERTIVRLAAADLHQWNDVGGIEGVAEHDALRKLRPDARDVRRRDRRRR